MDLVYDYREENRPLGSPASDRVLLRPAVLVRLAGPDGQSQVYEALVDSGCDHVLAPEWIARTIGVEPDKSRETLIHIGGAARRTRFAEAEIELCEPGTEVGQPAPSVSTTWRTTIGFFMQWRDPNWLVVLGQCGFFDQFTVVLNRHAQRLALTDLDEFDRRWPPTAVADNGPGPPRFSP